MYGKRIFVFSLEVVFVVVATMCCECLQQQQQQLLFHEFFALQSDNRRLGFYQFVAYLAAHPIRVRQLIIKIAIASRFRAAFNGPQSTGSNPMSRVNRATVCLAFKSSPAMKAVNCSLQLFRTLVLSKHSVKCFYDFCFWKSLLGFFSGGSCTADA